MKWSFTIRCLMQNKAQICSNSKLAVIRKFKSLHLDVISVNLTECLINYANVLNCLGIVNDSEKHNSEMRDKTVWIMEWKHN